MPWHPRRRAEEGAAIARGRDLYALSLALRKIWQLYLREGDRGRAQYASPMLAGRFGGLPPAYIEVEEFDCLHDEGAAYARALEAAGGAVQLEDVEGTFHGFDFFAGTEIAKKMVQERIQALRRAFEREPLN